MAAADLLTPSVKTFNLDSVDEKTMHKRKNKIEKEKIPLSDKPKDTFTNTSGITLISFQTHNSNLISS